MNTVRRVFSFLNTAAFAHPVDQNGLIGIVRRAHSVRLIGLAALAIVLLSASGAFTYTEWRERSKDVYTRAAATVPETHIVYLADDAERKSAESRTVAKEGPGPMREVNIANTGAVLLRGATVRSIVGPALDVSIAWGTSEYAWRLETDMHTRLLDSKGEKVTIQYFQVGDVVSVTGMLESGSPDGLIDAEYIQVRQKFLRE